MAPRSPKSPRSPKQGSPKPHATDNDKDKDSKEDRKRVGKACDRCRLKKSKCDGLEPCNRCRSDNGICQYGQRKKTVDKVYPKGFTDHLAGDYTILIKAVTLLYSYHTDRKGEWDIPDVPKNGPNSSVLIHDIAKSLNLLEPPAKESDEERMLTEDPDELLKEYVDKQEFERRVAEAVQQRVGTPSVHDFPMGDARSASMSRSSSFGSMQQGPTFPKLQIPPHRRVQITGYPTVAPQPQYFPHTGPHQQNPHAMPSGMMPPTPSESPSEEAFPHSTMQLSFQQSLNELNKSKLASFSQPHFSTPGPQLPGNYVSPNIQNWMNQAQSPISPATPLHHTAAAATPMLATQRARLLQTQLGTPAAAVVLDESMLAAAAAANPGSAFSEDVTMWGNPALQSGHDPDMGVKWDNDSTLDDLF